MHSVCKLDYKSQVQDMVLPLMWENQCLALTNLVLAPIVYKIEEIWHLSILWCGWMHFCVCVCVCVQKLEELVVSKERQFPELYILYVETISINLMHILCKVL